MMYQLWQQHQCMMLRDDFPKRLVLLVPGANAMMSRLWIVSDAFNEPLLRTLFGYRHSDYEAVAVQPR